MNAIKNISIPEPCHQSWQQMESKDNGRHCAHCSKIVIDFTKMTNDEIIGYLSTTKNVCGRFEPSQLVSANKLLVGEDLPARFKWKNWFMAAGLFAATFFIKANAQTKFVNSPGVEQSPSIIPSIAEPLVGKIAVKNASKYRIIKGRILDYNNQPVYNAMVSYGEGSTSVSTDTIGEFSITVPVSVRKFTVSAIGYAGKEITISAEANATYHIKLEQPMRVMGGLAVTRTSPVKRIYNKVVKIDTCKVIR